MPLEKAFAIKAEPSAIWDALTADLERADPGTYEIERAVTGRELSLWVDLQRGIRALLTYELIPHDDHTEVVARMSPQGLRYAIFRIITFGRSDTNYEMILVQGLANLKRAVEGEPEAEDGEPEGP